MKKILALLVCFVMLFTTVALVACEAPVTVTFRYASGKVIEEVTVGEDGKVAEPTDEPTSGDKEFIGWKKDLAKEEVFKFDTVITENTDLYAYFLADAKLPAGKNLQLVGSIEGSDGWTEVKQDDMMMTFNETSQMYEKEITLESKGSFRIISGTGKWETVHNAKSVPAGGVTGADVPGLAKEVIILDNEQGTGSEGKLFWGNPQFGDYNLCSNYDGTLKMLIKVDVTIGKMFIEIKEAGQLVDVTFEVDGSADGEAFAGLKVDALKIGKGTKLDTAKVVAPEGYVVLGVYTDADCTLEYKDDNATAIDDATKMYVKLEKAMVVTVNYIVDLADGDYEGKSMSVVMGTEIGFKVTVTVKDGEIEEVAIDGTYGLKPTTHPDDETKNWTANWNDATTGGTALVAALEGMTVDQVRAMVDAGDDKVAGATKTSNALVAAVQDAITDTETFYVKSGEKFGGVKAPTGMKLDGLFTDVACETEFDLDTAVTADTTLYAAMHALTKVELVIVESEDTLAYSYEIYVEADANQDAIKAELNNMLVPKGYTAKALYVYDATAGMGNALTADKAEDIDTVVYVECEEKYDMYMIGGFVQHGTGLKPYWYQKDDTLKLVPMPYDADAKYYYTTVTLNANDAFKLINGHAWDIQFNADKNMGAVTKADGVTVDAATAIINDGGNFKNASGKTLTLKVMFLTETKKVNFEITAQSDDAYLPQWFMIGSDGIAGDTGVKAGWNAGADVAPMTWDKTGGTVSVTMTVGAGAMFKGMYGNDWNIGETTNIEGVTLGADVALADLGIEAAGDAFAVEGGNIVNKTDKELTIKVTIKLGALNPITIEIVDIEEAA